MEEPCLSAATSVEMETMSAASSSEDMEEESVLSIATSPHSSAASLVEFEVPGFLNTRARGKCDKLLSMVV